MKKTISGEAMTVSNNKNYSLYLAGVLNEDQFYGVEFGDQMVMFENFSKALSRLVENDSYKWRRIIKEDSTTSPEEKAQASSVINWFKQQVGFMNQTMENYKRKSVKFINEKADQVLSTLEKWAGIPEWSEEVEEIERIAREDAAKLKSIVKNMDVISLRKSQSDMVPFGESDLQETILGAIGKMVSMTAFKLIKFVLFDVLDVLLRTAINTMKQIMTPEAKGLKFMCNFIIAIMFPLVSLVGTGGSGFLIPAGLFYMTQVIKSIYQHVTGKPYLYEPA